MIMKFKADALKMTTFLHICEKPVKYLYNSFSIDTAFHSETKFGKSNCY